MATTVVLMTTHIMNHNMTNVKQPDCHREIVICSSPYPFHPNTLSSANVTTITTMMPAERTVFSQRPDMTTTMTTAYKGYDTTEGPTTEGNTSATGSLSDNLGRPSSDAMNATESITEPVYNLQIMVEQVTSKNTAVTESDVISTTYDGDSSGTGSTAADSSAASPSSIGSTASPFTKPITRPSTGSTTVEPADGESVTTTESYDGGTVTTDGQADDRTWPTKKRTKRSPTEEEEENINGTHCYRTVCVETPKGVQESGKYTD